MLAVLEGFWRWLQFGFESDPNSLAFKERWYRATRLWNEERAKPDGERNEERLQKLEIERQEFSLTYAEHQAYCAQAVVEYKKATQVYPATCCPHGDYVRRRGIALDEALVRFRQQQAVHIRTTLAAAVEGRDFPQFASMPQLVVTLPSDLKRWLGRQQQDRLRLEMCAQCNRQMDEIDQDELWCARDHARICRTYLDAGWLLPEAVPAAAAAVAAAAAAAGTTAAAAAGRPEEPDEPGSPAQQQNLHGRREHRGSSEEGEREAPLAGGASSSSPLPQPSL